MTSAIVRVPEDVVILRGDCGPCPLALLCLGGTLHVDRCLTCHGLYATYRNPGAEQLTWYVLRCTTVRSDYGELVYGKGRCCGLTKYCLGLERRAQQRFKTARKMRTKP